MRKESAIPPVVVLLALLALAALACAGSGNQAPAATETPGAVVETVVVVVTATAEPDGSPAGDQVEATSVVQPQATVPPTAQSTGGGGGSGSNQPAPTHTSAPTSGGGNPPPTNPPPTNPPPTNPPPTSVGAVNPSPTAAAPTSTVAANTGGGSVPTPTSTSTHTAVPPPTATATPTYTQAAPQAQLDGDSQFNPAVNVNFSPTGNRQFTYSNDVSAPAGDIDDWVQFKPVNSESGTSNVWFTLACEGDAASVQWLRAILFDNGTQTTQYIFCGDTDKRLTLTVNHTYQLRLTFIDSDSHYVQYVLTVVGYK